TSRLRLAISSVQTFIQRCLLNLENANNGHPELNVAPSAIDADQVKWRNRFRVWGANREIFLFPENWMEPELRLDKSDLFQAWEAVNPNIEGDHIVLAVWRGRLNVFWVTFIPQPQAPSSGGSGQSGAVSDLTFAQMANVASAASAQRRYQLQLHWSEYFQGKW